jgi:phosphatidylinositol glycan class W
MIWFQLLLTACLGMLSYQYLKLVDVNEIRVDNAQISLKQQKEAFVTGHGGTTPFELMVLCAAVPIGTFLFIESYHFLKIRWFQNQRQFPFWIRLALEYTFILFPICWNQSFLFIPWGILLLFAQWLLAQILNSRRKSLTQEETVHAYLRRFLRLSTAKMGTNVAVAAPRVSLLTSYRATVMYMTLVAILAVDFTIFPRRYAKTETQGYGLMDLGAGSFVYSSALVSSFAKGGSHTSSKTVFHKYIPLIILGLVRLATHKGLDYQEHVTEYGVHWNFLFSLVLVFNGAHFVRSFLKIRVISFPLAVLVIYQFFLCKGGGQSFIENAPRWQSSQLDSTLAIHIKDQIRNLVLANREGLFGCVGYLSLYLIGEHIGSFCLWNHDRKGYRMEARFLFVSIVLWILHSILASVMQIPVSRRSTNSSYVVWVMAHNTLQLFFFSCVFSVTQNELHEENVVSDSPSKQIEPSPPIFESINRNGFLIFVLANIMTGIINLVINTIACSHVKSFFIMQTYSMCLSGLSLFINKTRHSIRHEAHFKKEI